MIKIDKSLVEFIELNKDKFWEDTLLNKEKTKEYLVGYVQNEEWESAKEMLTMLTDYKDAAYYMTDDYGHLTPVYDYRDIVEARREMKFVLPAEEQCL